MEDLLLNFVVSVLAILGIAISAAMFFFNPEESPLAWLANVLMLVLCIGIGLFVFSRPYP
jgi:hypothetical protein